MQKNQITLLVRFKAKKGMGQKLQEAALKLVPLSRAEAGCLEYNFHASPDNADTFMFYENWADKESLDKHTEMPYLIEFRDLLNEILEIPAEFNFWNMLS